MLQLYPRKDNNAVKEKVVQGKKKVSASKLDWVPIKNNPSSTFEVPQQNIVPTTIVVQAQIESPIISPLLGRAAQTKQQLQNLEVPIQQDQITNTSTTLEAIIPQ